MNYYGAKELAASYRTVRKNTIAIAEEIPEEQYRFRPSPESRSVAQTLVHIAMANRLPEQIHFEERRVSFEGFDFFGAVGKIIAEENVERSKKEILELLRQGGEKFAALLESAAEDFLGESVTYPAGMEPPAKSRFEMLMSAKEHEMHHRGQLMTIERMLGIVPHLTRHMQARVAEIQAAKASS
ncbi:MAG: DinB family protein [Acidobacteria bacterium]|nr:DinB family protein [Acidobacteriota bacterium]